jgi:hypothetical protein
VNSDKAESTKESTPLTVEGEPVVLPPPRKTVAKVKASLVAPSTDASIPSSSNDHVSDFPFSWLPEG